MQLQDSINNIVRDEFGRPTALLALNKPAGISSHDLVDRVRKQLQTRKVGHAGALDVFADGLMLVLVGKATKKANTLINLDKEYVANILLGAATDTQDREGQVTAISDPEHITEEQVRDALEDFAGEQEQYVSLYSSVKVDGNKLRVLMRDDRYDKDTYIDEDGNKHLRMTPKPDQSVKQIDIVVPRRLITMYEIELLSMETIPTAKVAEELSLPDDLPKQFKLATVRIRCTKGTYVRQFAEDLGEQIGIPACLFALTRTGIADVSIDDAVSLESLS